MPATLARTMKSPPTFFASFERMPHRAKSPITPSIENPRDVAAAHNCGPNLPQNVADNEGVEMSSSGTATLRGRAGLTWRAAAKAAAITPMVSSGSTIKNSAW